MWAPFLCRINITTRRFQHYDTKVVILELNIPEPEHRHRKDKEVWKRWKGRGGVQGKRELFPYVLKLGGLPFPPNFHWLNVHVCLFNGQRKLGDILLLLCNYKCNHEPLVKMFGRKILKVRSFGTQHKKKEGYQNCKPKYVYCSGTYETNWHKKNSMVWVREWTIPTERPPLVGEVIANFLRIERATWSAWRIPTAVFSVF
jgi:hypothetical protein